MKEVIKQMRLEGLQRRINRARKTLADLEAEQAEVEAEEDTEEKVVISDSERAVVRNRKAPPAEVEEEAKPKKKK